MFTSSSSYLLPLSTIDLFTAIGQNDFFGKLCLLVLTLLSLISLTIIFAKWFELQRVKHQSIRFQRIIESEGSWEALFLAAKKFKDSPLSRMLKETYVECRLENWFEQKGSVSLESRLSVARETISGVIAQTMAREENRLQGKLTIIATVSTIAPFIGLFGTVWGVLGAFQALGREGSAALTALAPGISTALMTTIFGLLAAIPALVFYNIFAREVHKLTGRMEAFSYDLENAVRKQIIADNQ